MDEEPVDVPVRFQVGEPRDLPVDLGDDRETLDERRPACRVNLLRSLRRNLKRHQATLWASDFAGVKSFTTSGMVDLFILFFIHIETRRVFLAGVTANPHADWVTQQARNVTMAAAEMNLGMTHLLIDHDSKYVAGFDAVLQADGVEGSGRGHPT